MVNSFSTRKEAEEAENKYWKPRGGLCPLCYAEKLRKNEKDYQPSGKNKELCIYNDGAFCKKGLPGTQCDVAGCVAYKEK